MKDTETTQMLTDGDEVRLMTESKGWGFVKAKLDTLILDLQNINNLDFSTQETVLFDLKARKMAADLLFKWLKDDVYGFIEQQAANRDALTEKHSSAFIGRD